MTKEKTKKYLLENVAKIYMRTPRGIINRIHIEAKNFDKIEYWGQG